MCQVIAECVDGRTGRVKIPGFYEDVLPPSKAELEDFRRSGFTVNGFKKDHLFKSLRTNDALDVMKPLTAEKQPTGRLARAASLKEDLDAKPPLAVVWSQDGRKFFPISDRPLTLTDEDHLRRIDWFIKR